jgi:ABC-type transporter Mla MlaB component
MRTIVFEEPFSITVRLEGALTAEAAADLSTRVDAWQNRGGKKVRLDLGDVSSVDAEARAGLRRLRDRGVTVSVVSPALHEREGDRHRDSNSGLRAWLSRFRIRLSSRPEQPQSLFRRLLCAVLPAGAAGCPCTR